MTRRALVLVDLGFGDAGKGLLTDFFVRKTGARWVVRYNGGAQAGHNVVAPDGRHHTFAQFGAGTFIEGVHTLLSRHVVVHPPALLAEAAALERVGVGDALQRLRVSERARVITPFHQTANRLRELARGGNRHGSCGVGVGETVADDLAHPGEAVRVGDLRDAIQLRRKLARIRERKWLELREAGVPLAGESAIFEDESIGDEWIARATRIVALGIVASEPALENVWNDASTVVFEGAQGVLLDERHGFHPHTTWSDCTAANAEGLVAEGAGHAETVRVGILRSHAVRHGPGPLPTEHGALATAVTDHNRENAWQGPIRYGWFDAVLARYALGVAGPIEQLAITHMDAIERLGAFRFCSAYRVPGHAEPIESLPPSMSFDELAEWTKRLRVAVPRVGECDPARALSCIERALGRRVDLVSHGPTAADVRSIPTSV